MNKHKERDLIASYVNKNLSAKEVQIFELHLGKCESCRIETSSQQDLKIRFAQLSRRLAPPNLISQLKQEFLQDKSESKSWYSAFFHFSWKPIGALVLASSLFAVWFANHNSEQDKYIDLEPLLASHTRYRAESLIPPADMVASDYSTQLVSYRENVGE